MREIRPYGSVRGARGNARPYRDRSRRPALRALCGFIFFCALCARACRQLSQMAPAARYRAARKFRAVLSWRVAIGAELLDLGKEILDQMAATYRDADRGAAACDARATVTARFPVAARGLSTRSSASYPLLGISTPACISASSWSAPTRAWILLLRAGAMLVRSGEWLSARPIVRQPFGNGLGVAFSRKFSRRYRRIHANARRCREAE